MTKSRPQPHIKVGIVVTPHFVTNFATSPDGRNVFADGLAELVQSVLNQTVDKLMETAAAMLARSGVELLPPSHEETITALQVVVDRMRADPATSFAVTAIADVDDDGRISNVRTDPTGEQRRAIFGDREGGGTSKPS